MKIAQKKQVIMARVIKRGEDDGSFDQEFWDKIGTQGRLAATWQMVQEVNLIRGRKKDESRLQRTVETILRRKS